MFLWCVQYIWGAGASGVATGGTLPRGRSDVSLLSSSGGARRGGCRVRLHAGAEAGQGFRAAQAWREELRLASVDATRGQSLHNDEADLAGQAEQRDGACRLVVLFLQIFCRLAVARAPPRSCQRNPGLSPAACLAEASAKQGLGWQGRGVLRARRSLRRLKAAGTCFEAQTSPARHGLPFA
jgi:hypothetical protein